MNWVKNVAQAGARRASLHQAVAKFCYTCPFPLALDGRRIDSLYKCPTHGQTKTDFPIAVGFAESDKLPPLPVPPGTYQELPRIKPARGLTTVQNNVEVSGDGAADFVKHSFESLKVVERSSCAFLLTLHKAWTYGAVKYRWEESAGFSMAYWVSDGVIVDEQKLSVAKPCSAAVFINAVDLKTDLTSFRLAFDAERIERLRMARHCLIDHLGQLSQLDEGLDASITRKKRTTKSLGTGLVLLGVATFWMSAIPVAAGVVLAGAGAGAMGFAGAGQGYKVDKIRRYIEELREALAEVDR